ALRTQKRRRHVPTAGEPNVCPTPGTVYRGICGRHARQKSHGRPTCRSPYRGVRYPPTIPNATESCQMRVRRRIREVPRIHVHRPLPTLLQSHPRGAPPHRLDRGVRRGIPEIKSTYGHSSRPVKTRGGRNPRPLPFRLGMRRQLFPHPGSRGLPTSGVLLEPGLSSRPRTGPQWNTLSVSNSKQRTTRQNMRPSSPGSGSPMISAPRALERTVTRCSSSTRLTTPIRPGVGA
ncbi:unnamed protein product, partial [Prunus brigantina]